MELGIISLSDLAAGPEMGRPVAELDRLDETLAYARAADELGLDVLRAASTTATTSRSRRRRSCSPRSPARRSASD